MLIDSHAHLDDKRYDEDRDEIISSLKDKGVELVVNIGADMESSISSLELAKKHDNIYAVLGIHPHSASQASQEAMNQLRDLAQHEKVVAIGEIGLDFYYDNSPRDQQRKWFKEQLKLAKELNLPVVIHTRDAAQETFDIIKEAQDGSLRGVMHCYSGSLEMAREYVKLGFYISLAGPVTFKNARVSHEVAKGIDLEWLLVETDCPYLTPEPYRGKRNEPAYVNYVAEKIAQLKEISFEEVAEVSNKNTRELFGLERI